MDSPVPASMFAPEPSSPGAARAAAAAARLHDGFDSDCSEDGEALNGEPELDLTSKVGPGAGVGARRDLAPREPRGGPSRLPGDGGGGRGRARPPASAGGAGGSRRWAASAAPTPVVPSAARTRTRPPALRLGGRSQPLDSATWNSGARRPQRPARCRRLRDREAPLDCPRQRRVGGGWGRGSGGAGGPRIRMGSGEASLPGVAKGNRK